MKTVTIRDLRLRWPELEKALQLENELTVTRDGQPVAKLVRMAAPNTARKRWDPQAHLGWLKKTWGNKIFPSADAALARDRAERWEQSQA